MSKKINIAGNKFKLISDSTLAHSHKAGAIVEYLQPAKDNIWGLYYFIHYPRSYNLLNKSIKAHKKVKKLLKKIRSLPLDKLNTRLIPDDIRDALELESLDFVIYLRLGLDHLSSEILQTISTIRSVLQGKSKISWDNLTTLEKIKQVHQYLNISETIPNDLTEVLIRRDIAEHPTEQRIYNAKDIEWKNVHLAWVISSEIDNILDNIIKYINSLIKAFENFKKQNDEPVTLTGVQPGVKSLDSFKKNK